jgi:error-prone DNA polymerase
MFADVEEDETPIALPLMGPQQEVFADYESAGLSLKAHPIAFFREHLDRLSVVPSRRLTSLLDGSFVRVGGLVLVRQRPGTAKGITFATIEDETGFSNLIIRMNVWEKFHRVARTAPAFIASGRLQNQQGVIHVLVSKLENLNDAIGGLRSTSRNFH